MSNGRRFVGEVQVESGQMIIADPQHIDRYAFSILDEASLQSGQRPNLAGQIMDDRAFAFDTNYGDGKFNIYKVFGADGRLLKMEIELAPPVITPDDEEWLPEDDYEDDAEEIY